jgi:hypothetical protein
MGGMTNESSVTRAYAVRDANRRRVRFLTRAIAATAIVATAVFARAAASHTNQPSSTSSSGFGSQFQIQGSDDGFGQSQDDDFFFGPSQGPTQSFGVPSASTGGS